MAPTEDTPNHDEFSHETPIYGHIAGDDGPFVSFDVDYPVIQELTPDTDTPTLTDIEGQWLDEWNDALDTHLTPEQARTEDPPQVGTLRYTPGGPYRVTITPPDE